MPQSKEAILLPSAARTADPTVPDLQNVNGETLHVTLDVTVPGTGSITLTIQGKDPASGKYYTVLAGAAVTTQVTNIYKVGRGLTAAANSVASDVVPKTFRIIVTHNNANAITYSVGYSLV